VPRFPVDYSDLKELGRTGEKVPAIGLGTWAIRNYREAEEVLVEAIDRGLYLIDTAEMYDSGRAEELVGRVVKRVGRDRVFIVTKMLPSRLTSADEVEKAARASLRRLGVNYVDLYLIHWPNYSLPIDHQVRVFETVYLLGYTRYIGVSNFSRSELEEAITATRSAEIVVDQVKYSVVDKAVENDLLPYALEAGVTIQAYTPLERGAVIYHPGVKRVALKAGKTPVQVALNYLISRPHVIAIVKTERKDHLDEILGALGWRLRHDLIEELEKI
jgi:diketogulonate reductase-like aldo/keto reductase